MSSASPLQYASDSLRTKVAAFEAEHGYRLDDEQLIIGRDESFLAWCERLGAEGLKVDGHPFTLDDRPALRRIYRLIPTTVEEANKRTIVVMKGAQVGMTIWEMLADIYLAVKFEPCSIGMYVPDRTLAAYKSTYRFMPVLRTVPAAHQRLRESQNMLDSVNHRRSGGGEGNVMTRVLRDSKLLFLWTSGKVATESFPMDVISFDEVQEMMIADMEKTRERMSASRIRFCMMLSTAKWPDADIHYWYRLGTQERFHTRCGCPEGVVLDEKFPACVVWNDGRVPGAPLQEYVYQCPDCLTWIPDPQAAAEVGDEGWVAENRSMGEARNVISVHLPQTLSPTVSPQEIIESFHDAQDLQNFYNRKLGKPYQDPSQVPVTMELLAACVEAGRQAGVQWLTGAKNTYMGIDQMGAFNVVIIKRRLPDGRQATVHVEAIYGTDPFARCDALMADYGVACCVVETLPNYNDAKRFANRHPGRVFLAGYADLGDDMMRWGDAILTRADRKTDEEERDRYTVTLDQYKCMQVSMARLVKQLCLFPDPAALEQEIVEKGRRRRAPILRDMVFLHFTKTALVVEQDKEQKKFRRKVVKIGIDPHFSYANMLCDVAWARAHGTATFIIPRMEGDDEKRGQAVERGLPGLPDHVRQMMTTTDAGREVCGNCAAFDAATSQCGERGLLVRPTDPGCPLYISASRRGSGS